MNSNPPDTRAQTDNRGHRVAIAALVIAILTFLFGSGVVISIRANRPPRFTVSALNTLTEDNVYEITDHFIGVGPTEAVTLTWGIEVIPDYSGGKSYGEVRVLVKNMQDVVVAESRWNNLKKDAGPLVVELDPYRLSSEVEKVVGLQENIFEAEEPEFPQATFDVEIVQSSRVGSPLYTDTLVIRNTPWYHYTVVSKHGDSVNAFVYGKNLGDPSDFFAVGNVYEITEIPGRPWDKWPWVDYQQTVIDDVGSGAEFTTTLTFPNQPNFRFENGKVYVVETYIIKKQNYVEFDDGPWVDTGNKWRFGDLGSYHLINP